MTTDMNAPCSDVSSLFANIGSNDFIGVFSCSVCPFVTKYKGSLQTHVKIHTDDKPFACTMCSYRAKQKITLENHIKTHTGEKPFACHICDYRNVRKVRLKYHLLTKHNIHSNNV